VITTIIGPVVVVVVLEQREKIQNQMAHSLQRFLLIPAQPQSEEKAETVSPFLGLRQQLQLH
jgi:hypothetical protein